VEVRLAEVPAVPLAVVRRTVSRAQLSAAVREGCGVVWKFARARGLPAGRHVAVYLDDAITVEVGVEVAAQFEEAEGVVRSATPAALVASVTSLGPYERLGLAHGAVHAWCRANGHRLAGPNWEVYGHWLPEGNTDPTRIRTDVHYLVRPGAAS
jgi:effector-binding domain-containing protein